MIQREKHLNRVDTALCLYEVDQLRLNILIAVGVACPGTDPGQCSVRLKLFHAADPLFDSGTVPYPLFPPDEEPDHARSRCGQPLLKRLKKNRHLLRDDKAVRPLILIGLIKQNRELFPSVPLRYRERQNVFNRRSEFS